MLKTRAKVIVLACVLALARMAQAQMTVYWDGGGLTQNWSERFNWSTDELPQSGDFVRHETADEIQLDLGSQQDPVIIASFTATGGGTLRLLDAKGLKVTGDFVSNATAYTLVLDTGVTGTTYLEVAGALSIGDDTTVNQNCQLKVGTSPAQPRSDLWGDWLFTNGAVVTFEGRWGTGTTEPVINYPLHMTLSGGSTVIARNCRYMWDTFVPDAPAEHSLRAIGPGNLLEVGPLEFSTRDYALHFGWKTYLQGSAIGDPSLTLRMYARLSTWSQFYYPVVRDNWDTRNVDVIFPPRAAPSPATPNWFETISNDMEEWFEAQANPPVAVIFTDAPCFGAWRDYIVEDATGYEEPYVEWAKISDQEENAYTDNPSSAPPGPGHLASNQAECLLVRNVKVGRNRTLDFPQYVEGYGQVRIYYWGQRSIDDSATIRHSGIYVPPSEYNYLMTPAVATIVGDWDGSCWITLSELRDLLTAIESGLYNPLFDSDCDHVLTLDVDYARASANYQTQPPCGTDSMGAGESAADGAWDEKTDALAAGVAADMTAFMTAEELAAYVAGLEAAAVKFAGTPVGDEMAALLSYLK